MADPFDQYSRDAAMKRFQPTDAPVLEQLGTRVFEYQRHDWGTRFLATAGPSPIQDLLALVRGLEPELTLLVVLVVEYQGQEEGRFESPSIPWDEVETSLMEFAPLFEKDGRICLWLSDSGRSWQVIYDRHELFYLYGKEEWFRDRLCSLGFQEGEVVAFGPHYHSYLREYNSLADQLLSRWDFHRTELRDGDVA